MLVPFVDLKGQYQNIAPEINDSISSVFQKANFILGENVSKFEQEFCQYLGGGHAVSVNSGTDALYLSLLACGITSGDEVITVSHTFIATYLAIVHVGAKPIFVDINPSTFNIDTNKIEEKITKKTKVIMPVHLYGHPANVNQITKLAQKYNLYVIEDACQAHGARISDTKTGLLGDFGCFSFYPTKNLGAYGDGGVVVTKNEEFREKLLYLRNYGQKKKYFHDYFGINTRLDELQAAILRVKLKYLDKWNESRRKIAKKYCNNIKSQYVSCPVEKDGYFHVYHLYVIKTPCRYKLQKWLAKNGIQTQIHYPVPVHLQKCFLNEFKSNLNLPVTERISKETLSLPMYPEMSKDQLEHIVKSINAFHV
jgi:dTDP-4-amino-4,6-dideoxygalactose transaminase